MLWAKMKAVAGIVLTFSLLGEAALAASSAPKGPAAKGETDWPCWRGPDRNGVAPASPKLLDSIPPGGPALAWKSEYIPASWFGGWSSPVVAEGKVFLYEHWTHPNCGGNALRPITDKFLETMGWVRDMPDDLAKKLEDAWASPTRPDAAKCPKMGDLILNPPDLNAFLAKTPELKTYIDKFTASLPPDQAKKFGAVIRQRLCMKPKGFQGGEPWANLVKLSKFKDKEFKTQGQFYDAMGTIEPLNADGSLHVWGIRSACTLTDTLVCLDAATGKLLWKKDFGEGQKVAGYPMSSTPAVSNGKVFFIGATGTRCLSTKDGSLIWEHKHNGTQASILATPNFVYDPSTAEAYNPDTGKVIWAVKNGKGRSGDSSPVLLNVSGKECILCKGHLIDSKDGTVLWQKPVPQNESSPAASGDDLVVIANAYKITLQGATEVWNHPWGSRNEWRVSPLLYQGYVYCSDAGKNTYRCVDVKTGEAKWAKEGVATDMSSAIIADGKVITLSVPGHSHNEIGCDVVIFRATPEKYQEVGRFSPHAASCESPALADGRIYFRTESPDGDYAVACYDLRAR